MEKYNKDKIIAEVAENTGFTKKDVGEIVNAVFQTIVDEVSSGNEMAIHGFGKFSPKMRTGGERKYTFGEKKGETYIVPDKVVPTFSPSKNFKDSVAE